jgi:flagellar hook protein FlgE
MSFSQALSGLAAQSENIKIITNNIANSQTVGFKSSGASFADVFAGTTNRVGLGVQIAAVMQDFTAGDLENTGRDLDLAIAGQGFYRLEQPGGEVVYSRNGQFNQDAEGFLRNASGQYLTGYGLSNPNDAFSAVVAGGDPTRLFIPPDDLPPSATTRASAIYNLDSSTETGIGTTQKATVNTDYADPPATADIDFHFSTSFSAFDSLGNQRTVTTYYTKTADNTWEARIALDGVRREAVATPDFTLNFNTEGALAATAITGVGGVAADPGVAGGPSAATGQVTLTFDEPTAAPPAAGEFDLGGAATLAFELDLAGTTQFNNNSVQNSLDQNGYTSGTLVGIEVQEDGTVTRIFTNEERRDVGQVVLTNFANPEGLAPDGDNAWRQTAASGEPVLGTAGTGVFGQIASGVLENSNVELAEQLVDLIVAQRAYQANSSSISTQDEMLQTVINL